MGLENRNQQLGRAIKVLQAKNTGATGQPRRTVTKLIDKTFYLNFEVTGMSGINQLIDPNTKKLVGVTNFDGDVLNFGRDVVIDSIRAQYTTKGSKPEDCDWQNKDVIPAEIQNADLRIKQTNDLLVDLPMTDIQNFKDVDYRALSTTPLIRSKEEFQIELEFPKGVTVPVAKRSWMRLEVRVTEAKKS